MKNFLRKLSTITAYAFAALLILLAVAVGLFRLFLPRLPEYQDEIKGWAGNAIGMEVEFSGMNARWGLSGPELEFYDAELVRRDNQKRMLAAERVGIGISVGKLLFDRTFVVDHILIRDTSVEVRELDEANRGIEESISRIRRQMADLRTQLAREPVPRPEPVEEIFEEPEALIAGVEFSILGLATESKSRKRFSTFCGAMVCPLTFL